MAKNNEIATIRKTDASMVIPVCLCCIPISVCNQRLDLVNRLGEGSKITTKFSSCKQRYQCVSVFVCISWELINAITNSQREFIIFGFSRIL